VKKVVGLEFKKQDKKIKNIVDVSVEKVINFSTKIAFKSDLKNR